MIRYAKLKDIQDEEFIKYHKEVANYHEKVGYDFDWSRQWEYPWILRNVDFDGRDVADAGGGHCHFPCIVSRRAQSVTVFDRGSSLVKPCKDFNIMFEKQLLHKQLKTKNKFDIVLCISVLEHIKEWKSVIKNLTKLTKKGGVLVMTIDLFLDNRQPFKKEDIPCLLKNLDKKFNLGKINLNEENLYRKKRLQELKFDMPHLYKKNYPDRTSLGIIIKKL